MIWLQGSRAVLFDLDGTLVDSAPDLAAAVNRVKAEEGEAPVDYASLRAQVSKGGRAMLLAAFPERSVEQRELLLPRFLQHYHTALDVLSQPFEGIPELLEAIESRGIVWGIITNKPEYLAVEVVRGMGWASRCAVLLGGDSLPEKKPHPLPLLTAAQRIGIAAEHCAYVGDDERDILAARAARMRSVAAHWGYRDALEDPFEWRADWDLRTPLQGF